MAELPAINTSPLIFLTKGGFLDLLLLMGSSIIVPNAVATEIQAYGSADVTAVTLNNTDWLVVQETPPVPNVIQNWDLGLGESAVLKRGYVNPGTEVILDDLAARRCAANERNSGTGDIRHRYYCKTSRRNSCCTSSFRTIAPVWNVFI